jgi:acyl-CoA synthetase (AMP-forming)/AMP-acid ligase II
VPGVDVEVRDAAGRPLPDGEVGRIFVRSASLMREYLGQPEATARVLAGGWLDTADLGFIDRGELFVHGRASDVVIVRGANHAPEEFESCLEGLPGLRPGCAVAVGPVEADGSEGLVILAEREQGRPARQDGELGRAVSRAVTERAGVTPVEVRILDPGTLPRTSSGKMRRGEARRRLLTGTLLPPARVTALGLARRMASSGIELARTRARRARPGRRATRG